MSIFSSRHASTLAVAAAFSLAAAPVAAEAHGRHGGRYDGWGHRHDGVDAGDVLAGVLILGGIAAIASAASKAAKERDPEGRPRYPERDGTPRYGERDDRPTWGESRGIDGAVDTCVGEIENSGNRVDSVDAVNRAGDGWRVEGRTGNDRAFACSIDRDGRVRSVTVDGRAAWNGADRDSGEQRYVSEPVIQPIRR